MMAVSFGILGRPRIRAILVVLGLYAGAAQGMDFAMDGADILHEDEDLGVVNGHLSCGVSKGTLGQVRGLWAPPWASSDFAATWHFDGKPLVLERFRWEPQSVLGVAGSAELKANYSLWLVPGQRAVVQVLRISSSDGIPDVFDVNLSFSGTLDRAERWEFARPASKSATQTTLEDGVLCLQQGNDAIAIAYGPGLSVAGDGLSGHFEVGAGPPVALCVTYAVGPKEYAISAARTALASAADFQPPPVAWPFASPTLRSDNAALDRLYERSLVHLLMNRWEVPEFVLSPYYATGSIKGGCVCNYLWNFGEVWEILPLLDPVAMKAHIKHFLACDLTAHFAFEPLSGDAFGPWYMVNQEKIIGLIYFYTLITGDTAFLQETVAGQTIAAWAVAHATVKDDLTKPVALIDYGPSNSHLELRRAYSYNHVMPDLNGRRYDNYIRAAAIAAWAGSPRPDLLERAEALRGILKATLWDPGAKWFRFLHEDGTPELRYTIQVFKLFHSSVLDQEQVDGLLSHINDHEFLSAQGLHSMSKLDPAYDQVDIDNGGGGSCTCFPPQIAERLYKDGRPGPADEILKRILWWGARMPYWGDSIVANDIAYRKDTPLQCTIDGATVAQCVIFGLFGIAPQADGTVTISPQKTSLFKAAALGPLRLRGQTFTVTVKGGRFVVEAEYETWAAALGETVVLDGTAP